MSINNKSISSLPDCSDIINSWSTEYKGYLIKKELKDYELIETKTKIRFKGIIQQKGGKQLNIKEIGERQFNLMELHTTYDKLNNDDIIELEVNKNEYKRYRITKTTYDTTYYGFCHYDLMEDYK